MFFKVEEFSIFAESYPKPKVKFFIIIEFVATLHLPFLFKNWEANRLKSLYYFATIRKKASRLIISIVSKPKMMC